LSADRKARIAVIGLGNFGMTVASELARRNCRVLAIDTDPGRARDAQAFVETAVVASATDPEELGTLGVGQARAAIVSLGDQAHNSTLASLYLRRLGVPEILAKAIDEDHAEILSGVGATQVFYPEKEMAGRVARRLGSSNVLDAFHIASNLSVIEIATPVEFVGRSLAELDLGRRHGIQVLAVKELVPERIRLVPGPATVCKDSDILLLAGPEEVLRTWGATGVERKKFAVIGLGGFGRSTVRALHDLGHDVLAVDSDPRALDAVRPYASRVEVVDGCDRGGLEAAGVADADVGVVGLGSHIDVSLLATLALKQLHVAQIVAKAVTGDHAAILHQLGAMEVVHPERDVAMRVAERLMHPGVLEEIPYIEGYAFMEVQAPGYLWGKTLAAADLRRRHHTAVVAVQRGAGAGAATIPASGGLELQRGDILILLTRHADLAALQQGPG
jgi:trk system potassium uptake protein TrkA